MSNSNSSFELVSARGSNPSDASLDDSDFGSIEDLRMEDLPEVFEDSDFQVSEDESEESEAEAPAAPRAQKSRKTREPFPWGEVFSVFAIVFIVPAILVFVPTLFNNHEVRHRRFEPSYNYNYGLEDRVQILEQDMLRMREQKDVEEQIKLIRQVMKMEEIKKRTCITQFERSLWDKFIPDQTGFERAADFLKKTKLDKTPIGKAIFTSPMEILKVDKMRKVTFTLKSKNVKPEEIHHEINKFKSTYTIEDGKFIIDYTAKVGCEIVKMTVVYYIPIEDLPSVETPTSDAFSEKAKATEDAEEKIRKAMKMEEIKKKTCITQFEISLWNKFTPDPTRFEGATEFLKATKLDKTPVGRSIFTNKLEVVRYDQNKTIWYKLKNADVAQEEIHREVNKFKGVYTIKNGELFIEYTANIGGETHKMTAVWYIPMSAL